MNEAIEALKAYKAKCNHEGDIYSAMVVQRYINVLQRLNKKPPANTIEAPILQPGQV